jgi:hypothetical protein
MLKRLPWIAIGLYALALAVVVVRAEAKWGPEWAAWFAVIGLAILIVLWRVWRIVKFILFGGKAPFVATSQGTNFVPPNRQKVRFHPD